MAPYPMGLIQKTTITASILVISLMSAVASVSHHYFQNQLKATIAQSQFVMVTGLAREIERKLTNAHDLLIAAAVDIPQAAVKDPDQAQAFLDSMIGLRRIFDSHVTLLSPDGKILAETPFLPGRRGFDASFRPYYKNTVSKNAPLISEPYLSNSGDSHPRIMMTAPIFDKKGVLVGILSGAMDVMGENILQDLSRLTIGHKGYLYLTSHDGRMIIMHPDANRILKPVPPGINLQYDQAVGGFEGTRETTNSYGVRMLTSFKHLAVNDWILAANYPVTEANEIIFALEKKISEASAIGIIAILAIFFFLTQYFTHPLVKCIRHIETLPDKTGTDRLLDIRTHDEIGTLSQAFNHMIAELDRQKESLRKSEEQYRTIYNSANDAIFIHDLDTGAILDVNRKMCEMYGFSPQEARQMHIGDLSAGEAPYTHQDALAWISKAAQGEPQHFEWKAKEKTGRLFWVEIKMRRVEIGGTDRLLVTVSDITEHKQADEALRESERRLSQIIDFLPDATLAIGMDGRVIAWNRAIEEMTGVKAAEMLGKGDHAYSIPFYGIRRPILIDLVFLPTGELEKRYSFVSKQGHCVLVETEAPLKGERHILWGIARPLYDSDGNAVGAIESIRDITERKQEEAEKALLEDKLIQAQKMEAIGTLAGGIAHDFNNILTALIGYSSLLRAKMPTNDPLRAYADQILKSSEMAANLTRNLLTFTRKQVTEVKLHNINSVIQGIEKLLQRLLSEDIELTTALTDAEVTLSADVSQIDQLLLNLATNARDAMPKGGKLIIRTERIHFDNSFVKAHGFGKPGEYVLISVSDTGIGMNETIKEKIFDPFFTTKEVGKGTGLGLSTVYGIVKQYDGFITVYSEPGEGTAFHVYFPASAAKAAEDTIAHSLPIKGGTETILVAEDHGDSRRLIKEVLDSNGYTVIETVDGADAVNKYADFKDTISLLILDVVMPRKNGLDTFNEIRTFHPNIKVLFMSGYTGDIVLDKGILAKEFNFISKPLSPNALLLKIREILDEDLC